MIIELKESVQLLWTQSNNRPIVIDVAWKFESYSNPDDGGAERWCVTAIKIEGVKALVVEISISKFQIDIRYM